MVQTCEEAWASRDRPDPLPAAPKAGHPPNGDAHREAVSRAAAPVWALCLEVPGAGVFCVRVSSARVAEDSGCVASPRVAARGRGRAPAVQPRTYIRCSLSRQGDGRANGELIPFH